MSDIKDSLVELQNYDLKTYSPIVFDLGKESDIQSIDELIEKKKITKVVDYLHEQKKELQLINDPKLLYEGVDAVKIKNEEGVWIYYPWLSSLVHCLKEGDYNRLRLSRNRELITEEEEKEFASLKIGFAGLNVGNPIAICTALEGGSLALMKLADNDTLDFTNLNRFRATVADQGINKAILTARQVYEVSPFVKTEVLDKGISAEGIEDFLLRPRIDILVEEMDNLPLKIKIREKAREHGIPVVMITGNGAGVIVDVERYDKDKSSRVLNGYLKDDVIERIKNPVSTLDEKIALARDFMGKEHLSPRLNKSFGLIGRELVGIPQISEASFLRGAVVCNILRNLLRKDIPSGRYSFSLSDIIK